MDCPCGEPITWANGLCRDCYRAEAEKKQELAFEAEPKHNGLPIYRKFGCLAQCPCDDCKALRTARQSEETPAKNAKVHTYVIDGVEVHETKAEHAERGRAKFEADKLAAAEAKAKRRADNAANVARKKGRQPPPWTFTPAPRCPCGKFAYASKHDAETAGFTLAVKGVSGVIMRTYVCPMSGRCHLTRKL